ncbi:hypothetical protein KQX64_06955 [Rhodopseudomonas palustris]|nr:hypothetical protein KQX64_06955 [Rhodopseudomonas palustris]
MYGTVKLGNDSTSRARILRECRDWLKAFLTVNHTRLVVFEAPMTPDQLHGHTNINSIRQQIGLSETVDELLFDKFDVREAKVTDVRRFFLGTTRMKREDAKARTTYQCRRLGWKPCDDNAADALALWSYQCAIMSPERSVKLLPLWGEK